MKRLIEELMRDCSISHREAKITADRIVSLVAKKIRAGESVRLGCVTIETSIKKAQMVKSYLTPHPVYYLGDHIKWGVSISESWEKSVKPSWSKHAC